jgi:hypothetical protein
MASTAPPLRLFAQHSYADNIARARRLLALSQVQDEIVMPPMLRNISQSLSVLVPPPGDSLDCPNNARCSDSCADRAPETSMILRRGQSGSRQSVYPPASL